MKKIICAVLVAVMLASLCACGGDFVAGGDVFTADRARIHNSWGTISNQLQCAEISSYCVWEVDLQVDGVYASSSSDRKLDDIAVDLSEYRDGAYVIAEEIYGVTSYDVGAIKLWRWIKIGSQSYYVELLADIKKKIDLSISVKDLGECYELLYYSYHSDSIKHEYEGNISEIYTDKDGVLEAFSKHSIIAAKENVVLYTDFD